MSASLYSWTRFAGRTAAAALGREKDALPFKIVLVVTKRCHSRCVYCDIWKIKDRPDGIAGELTGEEMARLAAANPYLHWIDFTGGEPTDRPDFVEVVQAFHRHCPDLLLVHFPTNGLATRRIIAAAAELRRTVRARLVVTVSIDGPPELNDRLRGVPRDFEHALATFIGLRQTLGPENVYVGMTLHAHSTGGTQPTTREHVAATFAAVNAALAAQNQAPIGWETLHLNIPHLSQHYYGNQQAPATDGFGGPQHRAEVAEALRYAAAQTKQHGAWGMRLLERAYRQEALRYLATGRTRVPCSALQSTAYVSERGDLYPCTIWDKPLGNLRDSGYDLHPLLARARASGVRADVAAGRCPNCWTPCEAYPALAASPLRAARALL
ncbi:MAG: radical SAM protein [Verrucomicrobia bacterium]|nr:radical SAM protein [Verrucomicrobiota bacterium]